MKEGTKTLFALFIALVLVLLAVAMGVPRMAAAQQFGYFCESCPAGWPQLGFDGCSGEAQSPIDIGKVKKRRLPRLRFDYGVTELDVSQPNPTNFEAEVEEGRIRVGRTRYQLLQFHSHSKSEHFLFGEQFPLELHLVHQAEDDSLLVVGRFIEVGDELAELNPVIDAFRNLSQGVTLVEIEEFDLSVFVPDSKKSYRYIGSTTTPGCTEGVQWILINEPLRLSQPQIDAIQGVIMATNNGFDNFRPLQSRNGRKILTDVRKGDDDDDDSDDD